MNEPNYDHGAITFAIQEETPPVEDTVVITPVQFYIAARGKIHRVMTTVENQLLPLERALFYATNPPYNPRPNVHPLLPTKEHYKVKYGAKKSNDWRLRGTGPLTFRFLFW